MELSLGRKWNMKERRRAEDRMMREGKGRACWKERAGACRGRIRAVFGVAAFALLMAQAAFTVMGASQVRVLSVTVEADKAAAEIGEPSIRISPSSCSLSELTWSKPVEEWKPGKVVFGYLTLEGPGTFADRYTSSQCHVSGAEFRSASADKEEPSTLHVTIRYTPVVQLGETEEAGWSDRSKTKASWKKVPYATMYELRLYRDDTWIKTLETTATSIDISPYIQAEGNYTYQVRAKGKDAEERRYLLTGAYAPSEDTLFVEAEDIGQVGGTWRGSNEGRQYRLEDGTYPTSQWMMIMGQWYYFNEGGNVVIGWYYDSAAGKWYHTDDTGAMETGWKEIDGQWYHFGEDGAMETGWVQTNPGEWYHMGADGAMMKDTVIDGQYRLGSDGRYVP